MKKTASYLKESKEDAQQIFEKQSKEMEDQLKKLQKRWTIFKNKKEKDPNWVGIGRGSNLASIIDFIDRANETFPEWVKH